MRTAIRCVLVALLAASARPGIVEAQQAALSLSDMEFLLSQGVSSRRVLQVASGRCITFRADRYALDRLRAAGADESLVSALPGVCSTTATQPPPAAPPPVPLFDPGTAALQSLLVPGWGQFETGRSGAGLLFAVAGVAALGAALYEEAPDPADPSYTEMPYAAEGLAAYVGIAILAAIDAYGGANAANVRARSGRVRVGAGALPVAGGLELDLVRITF